MMIKVTFKLTLTVMTVVMMSCFETAFRRLWDGFQVAPRRPFLWTWRLKFPVKQHIGMPICCQTRNVSLRSWSGRYRRSSAPISVSFFTIWFYLYTIWLYYIIWCMIIYTIWLYILYDYIYYTICIYINTYIICIIWPQSAIAGGGNGVDHCRRQWPSAMV